MVALHALFIHSKNVPPLTCYSPDIHDPITIILGKSVTEKVRNQKMLCFLNSPIYRIGSKSKFAWWVIFRRYCSSKSGVSSKAVKRFPRCCRSLHYPLAM